MNSKQIFGSGADGRSRIIRLNQQRNQKVRAKITRWGRKNNFRALPHHHRRETEPVRIFDIFTGQAAQTAANAEIAGSRQSYGLLSRVQPKQKYPEFRCALKAGKEASDDRVEDSLYRLAIGWNGAPPNVTACIFWLKNRRKDRWRDVQNLGGDIGHYILADSPMSEERWIQERTKAIEGKALPSESDAVTLAAPQL